MTTPACYAVAIPHVWHDPTYTSGTEITIKWDSVPAAVTTLNVQYANVNSGVWTTSNTSPINPNSSLPSAISYAITGLTPNTAYKIRLASTDGTTTCYSVELLVTTGNN